MIEPRRNAPDFVLCRVTPRRGVSQLEQHLAATAWQILHCQLFAVENGADEFFERDECGGRICG
jgi:hypothetical protein